ncbi:extracellular solute-binding protein [Streptomyces castrisilvae]|uniref:Extracellular solute-binding protein n=1 Tax=Streptomyces castrisilvae TaxID=3033811 RepID=A0ABY9HKW1_9ACTN|nr:extracellular solute-binding protein [Streptomyces sp. Mut1]WLQ35197.1 extracellular solute-binding protein [Streptomyces sp. Mut1]
MALSLAATACGAGAKVGESKASVPCDIDRPKQQVTVNILAYNSSATDPFTNAVTGNCRADTLKINHPATDLTGQKQRAVQSMSGKSASYDLVEQFGTVFPLYADRGWTVPLDDLIAANSDRYDLRDIDPKLMATHQYKGKQYGLPTYWSVNHLVYRKDIFDKLGLKPPTTFAELRATGKKIEESGLVKYPLAVPMAPENDIQGLFGQAIRSLGGEYFEKDKPVPTLNTPAGVKAVNEIRSLMPLMSPQALSFSSPEVTTQLQTGQAAMGMLVTGRLEPLTDTSKSPHAADFGFATPPSIEKGGKPLSFLSTDGFAVTKNSKADPELLFQLAAVATSRQTAESALPQALPSRLDLLKNTDIPYAANALETLRKVDPQPLTPVPYMADVYSVIGAPVGDAISGKKPVKAALDEAQSAAVEAIDAAGYAK